MLHGYVRDWYLISGEADCGKGDCGEGIVGRLIVVRVNGNPPVCLQNYKSYLPR